MLNFVSTKYLYYINGKIVGSFARNMIIDIFKVNFNRSEFLSSGENFMSD